MYRGLGCTPIPGTDVCFDTTVTEGPNTTTLAYPFGPSGGANSTTLADPFGLYAMDTGRVIGSSSGGAARAAGGSDFASWVNKNALPILLGLGFFVVVVQMGKR